MKRSHKISIAVCVFIVIVTVFTFNQVMAGQTRPSGELRFALNTLNEETLFGHRGSVFCNIYAEGFADTLFGTNSKGEIVGDQSIAYKWQESEDGLTWTLWIRDDVIFHNGDSLTAEDVKFSIDFYSTKDTIIANAWMFKQHVDHVEVVPPNKVVITLKQKWPFFLELNSDLAGQNGFLVIYPKKYYEKVKLDGFMKNPIASGPYKFKAKEPGVSITLEAVDQPHWRVGVPKYKYLKFFKIPEESTRLAMLKTKQVDVAAISLQRQDEAKKLGLKIHQKLDAAVVTLLPLYAFEDDDPIKNRDVRKALAYAIDKEALVDNLLGGLGRTSGNGFGMWSWQLGYKSYPTDPYDPKKAKELLKNAGYPNGFELNFYSFDIAIFPGQKIINQAIASYWEAIGIKVKIMEMEYSTFRPYWKNETDPIKPSVFTYPAGNRAFPSYRTVFHSKNVWTHVKDTNLDKMIEDLETANDSDTIVKKQQETYAYIHEQYLAPGLFWIPQIFASTQEVPDWDLGKQSFTIRYTNLIKEKGK